MKTLLLLPFLLAPAAWAQDGGVPADGSSLLVLNSKWAKTSRKSDDKQEPPAPIPAAALTRADLNFERNRRANDPPGTRYPESDSVDARAAELEKRVRAAQSPGRKSTEGFEYRAKVKNAGKAEIEVVFWEYEFTETAAPTNVVRRQFLCGVQIKPGKEKELQAFSPAGPSAVIGVESLANKSGDLFAGKVRINRVEYSDGSIWQRRDWNFREVRASIARAVSTPWGAEMCRGL
jgi:hypothetical protein